MVKNALSASASNSGLKHQRGVAALLLVLLTGLSATVLAMGAMSYVRGSQKSQMTVHAQTQSEVNAWVGAQALTSYISGNPGADFQALGTLNFTKNGNNNPTLATATYQANCSGTTDNITDVCFDITGTSANSNTTLRMVYQITGMGTQPPPSQVSNPMVFNGNLIISGGGLSVVGDTALKNIAVNGDLEFNGAAESELSGCATGNIKVTGGGITDHGHLYSSGGDITIEGQDVKDISIWGKNVTINAGGGSYLSIKANEDIVISSAAIDTNSFMHADNITVTPGGKFTEVKVNTDFTLGNAGPESRQFGVLTGGGDFIVDSKDHLPIFSQPSLIAGRVRTTSGDPYSDPIANLSINQLATDPGLPGLPKCEVDVTAFDVNNLLAQANYIFYFDEDSGNPMLKVQNVNRKNGVSIDGTYDLTKKDIRTMKGLAFIQCNWYAEGTPCTQSANEKDGWEFTGLFAFPPGIVVFGGTGDPEKQNLAATQFKMNGISGSDQSPLHERPLHNSLLSTGSVILTTSGRDLRALTAPYFAEASAVCDQNFYPSQLCDKSAGASEFVTSPNDEGKEVPAYPLANNAIMTNKDFSTNTWTIKGHVIVGTDIDTGAGTTTIEGGVMAGLNLEGDQVGNTDVSQGGLDIDITGLTDEQLRVILGDSGNQNGGGGNLQPALSAYKAFPL